MNKIVSILLIFFFISGPFAVAVSPVSASELVADSWTTKTPMTQARASLGVVAVENRIYAIGGYTSDIVDEYNIVGNYWGTNECYDPETDTWVTLEPMPTPRAGFAIAEYKGKIYCIGGTNLVNVVEVYDVATNRWNTKAPVPCDVRDATNLHVIGVIDGKIFVINGVNLYLYTYDIFADSWTTKTIGLTLSWGTGFVSTVVDDKIIVIGKYGEHTSLEQKVLIYEPKSDIWSETKSTIDTHYDNSGAATTGRYAPKRVYVLGTLGNYAYDPVSNDWTTVATLPSDRIDFGVAVVDDILYVIGGYTITWGYDQFGNFRSFDHFSSLNEQYIPIGYHDPMGIFEFLSIQFTVVLVLTVGIAGGLFFYFKRKTTKKGFTGDISNIDFWRL